MEKVDSEQILVAQALSRRAVARWAVDAAQSAQAGNSLENMLCHQMAAAHRAAMKQLDRSLNISIWRRKFQQVLREADRVTTIPLPRTDTD